MSVQRHAYYKSQVLNQEENSHLSFCFPAIFFSRSSFSFSSENIDDDRSLVYRIWFLSFNSLIQDFGSQILDSDSQHT